MGACLPALAAGTPPTTRTILVVGDSLSAEYGLKRGTGWVAQLEQRLKAEKLNAMVVNAFYDLINGAVGLPTASKDRAIDTMLVSLADLLDYYRTSGEWGDKSVQVHLSTFQLLLRTEGARDRDGTEAILSGLQKVSRKAAKG